MIGYTNVKDVERMQEEGGKVEMEKRKYFNVKERGGTDKRDEKIIMEKGRKEIKMQDR
jgi:hypothetical protein